MHTRTVLVIALLSVGFVGCSTPTSRISKNEAAFNSYPADVQQKIKAGEVAVGFTPEQVKLAIGEPDRSYTRTTTAGVSEIWGYYKKGPSFSFGLGVGGGGGSTRTGAGVGVSTGGNHSDETLRVVFSAGKVTSVEQAVK